VRFLVTFALGEELAPWRKRGGFESDGKAGGWQAYSRRQGAIEIVALLTSMGQGNAARAVTRVLQESVFDLVISSGLAGGLRPGHRPGNILVGRTVRRLDDGREIELPMKWVDRAREIGAEEAIFVTSSRIIGTSEEKRRLGAQADAVDMESFAVIEEANARGTPAVVIRAIGDPVEMGLTIDFDRIFDANGRVRAMPLAAQIVRRPASVSGLVRLAWQSRFASTALAAFLDRYLAATSQAEAMQA
jgi:adenosylhomocysteine nucleosidase